MELETTRVQAYLERLLETDVQILALEPLVNREVTTVAEDDEDERALKMRGYGQPVLMHYRTDDFHPLPKYGCAVPSRCVALGIRRNYMLGPTEGRSIICLVSTHPTSHRRSRPPWSIRISSSPKRPPRK